VFNTDAVSPEVVAAQALWVPNR